MIDTCGVGAHLFDEHDRRGIEVIDDCLSVLASGGPVGGKLLDRNGVTASKSGLTVFDAEAASDGRRFTDIDAVRFAGDDRIRAECAIHRPRYRGGTWRTVGLLWVMLEG
jgi:hypothetical protein